MEYTSFITNFQSPQTLDELMDFMQYGTGSNLEALLNDYETGTNWTVPSDAKIGDVVFFMCARSSIDYRHLATVRRQAHASGDSTLIQAVEEQFALHAEYAGKILVVGIVDQAPQKRSSDEAYPGWGADIGKMILLKNPVDLSEFKSFIQVSSRSAITKLSESQYHSLMRLIEQRNPRFLAEFENKCVIVPGMDDILDEMTDEELETSCDNTAVGPAPAYSTTTVLRKRDLYLPVKVKKRARGICQLCMQPAPFLDKKGNPYLEAHHIVPLAEDGPDIESNMVALCPNCHRRMHVLASESDIDMLKQAAQADRS